MTRETAHEPIHPGEILFEEFLKPLGISQYRLAQTIGVSPRRINEIVHGQRRVTPETGIRLSRALGMSELFWVHLQADYDIEMEKERHGALLDAITPLTA
ncbi:MAG: HigA family addiction module antitoxin [Aeromicrobium sp.]|uniref:HigA family addiction module antitoxin n=1 Tax=Aeromicrobium sp. TaxID=1871063 RepID=UPI0039E4AB32